jgi:hypothetical protein
MGMRGDVLPTTSLSHIRQGEDGAWRRDAAQHVFAQRYKRRGGLGGDRARDQHRTAKRPEKPARSGPAQVFRLFCLRVASAGWPPK